LRQRNLVHQAMSFVDSLVNPVFRNDLSGMVFLGHFLRSENRSR